MTTARRRPYAPRLPVAERREQLMDAALQVIARDGFGGVSVDAVAREAGVTRPVVYSAFDGGLEQLLYALLDRQEARAMAQLGEVLPAALDPRDPAGWLEATIHGLVEVVTADPLTWRPILLATDATPAAVRARIDGDREVIRARFQALLEGWLVLRGGAPEGFDPEVASHALLAVAEHFGRMLLDDPGRVDAARLAGTARALLAGA